MTDEFAASCCDRFRAGLADAGGQQDKIGHSAVGARLNARYRQWSVTFSSKMVGSRTSALWRIALQLLFAPRYTKSVSNSCGDRVGDIAPCRAVLQFELAFALLLGQILCRWLELGNRAAPIVIQARDEGL